MDLLHILDFQTLNFERSLRQSNNTTLVLSRVYVRNVIIMFLVRTYSCNTTDSVGILKCKVLEYYSSVCAARELLIMPCPP